MKNSLRAFKVWAILALIFCAVSAVFFLISISPLMYGQNAVSPTGFTIGWAFLIATFICLIGVTVSVVKLAKAQSNYVMEVMTSDKRMMEALVSKSEELDQKYGQKAPADEETVPEEEAAPTEESAPAAEEVAPAAEAEPTPEPAPEVAPTETALAEQPAAEEPVQEEQPAAEEQPAEEVPAAFCPNCGAKLDGDSDTRFCPSCGYDLKQ